MTPIELRRWRRRHFPADTEKASREAACKWYGVKTRRAWEHWEQGTRAVPRPLCLRIKAEASRPGSSLF